MPTAEAYQVQIPASGHSRQKCDVRDRSAYPPNSDRRANMAGCLKRARFRHAHHYIRLKNQPLDDVFAMRSSSAALVSANCFRIISPRPIVPLVCRKPYDNLRSD